MSDISGRAVRLVLELDKAKDDVFKQLEIAQRHLDDEHMEALTLGKPYSPNGTPEVLSCSDEEP